MALSDIRCRTNVDQLVFRNLRFIDGRSVSLEIEPFRALIDRDGIVRFFAVNIPIFGIRGTFLHPYYTVTPSHRNTEQAALIASAVAGLADFLGSVGLMKAGGKIVQADGGSVATDMESYFLFDPSVTIKSFARNLITESTEERQGIDFGYHDIENDALMLPSAILRI